MAKTQCDLKSCFMCRHSLTDWLTAVAANRQNIVAKKGHQLFNEGEPVNGIYFIYSGVVKVHKRWGHDKDIILRFAKNGDVVGHMGLGPESFYPVSATVLEDGVICYVDLSFFESTLNINHQLSRQLIGVLAYDLQESEKRMRNLAHMPVKGRVAQALLHLQEQFGVNSDGFIDIELTRQDLASYTGAAYESLFRVMTELTEEKIIATFGKRISLVDAQALNKVIAETEL